MMRSSMVVLSLLAITPALPASAQMQPPNQWVMYCSTEGKRDCGVQATIDGNSLLGSFLVVRYSAAYSKLQVVGDGEGVQASIQVDFHPFISTSTCGQGICQYNAGKSAQLLQEMRSGSQITVQLQMQNNMAGPFPMTLSGFDAQYQKALEAQRAR
jgi:invasion protein IalB